MVCHQSHVNDPNLQKLKQQQLSLSGKLNGKLIELVYKDQLDDEDEHDDIIEQKVGWQLFMLAYTLLLVPIVA